MKKRLDLARLEEDILRAFESLDPIRILLFGSAARGNWDEHSDVDLIVVYQTEKRFLDRLEELYLRWPLPVAVDILAYTPEEFRDMLENSAFVQDIVAEGKVILDRSDPGSQTLDSASS